MCDKKNSVLFIDTECFVLSLDFKLPDESQVLLRVLIENNMYNVNLKNIVPSEDLTCLFAKAIIDESNLWHKSLGHISFKTINKLVKGNLVRGLPTKVFEKDNSCVACKKDKQHRASCKSKPVSSVDQPLFRIHMDLFGSTFVKSLSTGPTWLFDIDSLSGTMNYHPFSVENQANSGAGFQDTFDAEKNNDKDALVDKKEHDVDIQKSVSAVIHSSSSSAQTRKQADKTVRKNKGKSPVESLTLYRDLNAEFEGCSNNNSNGVNAVSSTVPTVGHSFINSTNTFSAAGPSNTAVSLTYGKSSFTNAFTSSHDLDMPDLEELTYSDDEATVGAEVDINNLESLIPVSPILTTSHKDHPISQIIGDLSLTTQIRSMEEPKWIHKALKDPSSIEAMQEELLQFKMQKV
nr:putative ribonuclease H-like domain-containing protein [Tanacetum cinerariifolium]